MFTKSSIVIASAMCIFIAITATAHSPEMHKKKDAEKPKCDALNNMDHTIMDMNDPIVQAMMKQCMDHKQPASNHHSEIHKDMEQKVMTTGDRAMDKLSDRHHEDDEHHKNMKKTQ